MTNIAILIGNSGYQNLSKLDCCLEDVRAMKILLEATEKYSEITTIENAKADELRTRIQAVIGEGKAIDELFFYYSGNGTQIRTQFFYCPIDFDPKQPNQTGLSATDLHTFLRSANANLIVKVTDACNSGTILVKSESAFAPPDSGFRNFVQIASCMDSQNSLTGDPLSPFTEKFMDASLRKTEGPVYYLDIINVLRDEFDGNNGQTPFHISQGTGKEQFVDDAKRLDKLRAITVEPDVPLESSPSTEQAVALQTFNLIERLRMAEAKFTNTEKMNEFSGSFFDNLKKVISAADFADYYDVEFSEHSYFQESTAHDFITRIMEREPRTDNFVTAEVEHKRKRRRNIWDSAYDYMSYSPDDYVTNYYLSLNCSMSRAQLRVDMNPKYAALKKLMLVVTCAPSLETCYVFEGVTSHSLKDFGKFNDHGDSIVERWYKFSWQESTTNVVEKIAKTFSEAVSAHLTKTESRLIEEQKVS